MKFLKLALTSLVLFYALFLRNEAYAATITSSATGNWSNATTWVISLTRPGTVTVNAGSTAVTGSALASFTTTLSVGSQILNTSSVVIGTVASIQSNTALTLVAGATNAMTNAGWNSRGVGSGDAVIIATGHNITVNSTYSCASLTMNRPSTGQTNTLTIGTNTLTVTGAFTMSATTTTRNNIINISTGSLIINGNLTTGTTGCQINLTSTGTLDMGGTVGSFTLSPGSTSTVIYDAAAAQTIRPVTYNNLN